MIRGEEVTRSGISGLERVLVRQIELHGHEACDAHDLADFGSAADGQAFDRDATTERELTHQVTLERVHVEYVLAERAVAGPRCELVEEAPVVVRARAVDQQGDAHLACLIRDADHPGVVVHLVDRAVAIGQKQEERRNRVRDPRPQGLTHRLGEAGVGQGSHERDLALELLHDPPVHAGKRLHDLEAFGKGDQHGPVARAQTSDELAQCLLGSVQTARVRAMSDVVTHGA